MSVAEELNVAFQLVDRFEESKLVRSWGIALIIIGVARFLLGWVIHNIFYLLYRDLGFNFNTGAFLISFLNTIISYTLFIALALLVIYTYFSVQTTKIRDCNIITSRVFSFGIALGILYLLTFIIQIPGSVYWEEVLAIFLTYHFLRRFSKIADFRELLYLGVTLFVISMVEVAWRVFYVFFLYGQGNLERIQTVLRISGKTFAKAPGACKDVYNRDFGAIHHLV